MEQQRSSCLEEPLFQKRSYSWGRCTTEFRSNALQNVSCLEFLTYNAFCVCLIWSALLNTRPFNLHPDFSRVLSEIFLE